MKRISSIAALAAVLALATGVAVAQNGNGGNSENTPAATCAGEPKGDGFGACVSAAAKEFSERASEFGRQTSEEASEEAKERGNRGAGSNGDVSLQQNGERQDSRNPTHGVESEGRQFGQEVSENAQGLGNGNGNGEGNRQDAERNPTHGVERPPEADGREFGEQVSENAQGNRPEGAGPPEGVGGR